ncbi:MAG TPA: energy-coupling factor transporter ATPase [Clostridiales bacterium]|nr:energy-coupling factor transporter ATPase [Clostridiales bacterium]
MQIVFDHVDYIYGMGTSFEKHALKDISFKIDKGEFIGLIGHTGSGKSTLIQHMNGLIRATSGKIFYNGEDIYDKNYNMRSLRSKVGLVFQYPEHQLFETTVYKDVNFGPKNLGLDKLEADLRTYEALKMVGIGEDLLDVSPFELSGGQKRRVAIAGILAMRPEVLVLDEPTAGLDPRGRDEILDQIANLHKESNITIILVTHSMEDVANYVERVMVMNNGALVMDQETRSVFARYRELEEIHLAAPQVTYIMNALKEKGFSVNTDVTTVAEAKNEIIKGLKR